MNRHKDTNDGSRETFFIALVFGLVVWRLFHKEPTGGWLNLEGGGHLTVNRSAFKRWTKRAEAQADYNLGSSITPAGKPGVVPPMDSRA